MGFLLVLPIKAMAVMLWNPFSVSWPNLRCVTAAYAISFWCDLKKINAFQFTKMFLFSSFFPPLQSETLKRLNINTCKSACLLPIRLLMNGELDAETDTESGALLWPLFMGRLLYCWLSSETRLRLDLFPVNFVVDPIWVFVSKSLEMEPFGWDCMGVMHPMFSIIVVTPSETSFLIHPFCCMLDCWFDVLLWL